MFEPYFDFKENPFKLAYDPAYLFLGRHHEEAIAHLKYAVLEGEGFIAITGAEGIGKTTVCRSFAESMDENTEVAYIYEATPNPKELLRTINAEFKILSETEDIKDLTDALNTFLMQKKLQGKRVAIFIDDAQNLNREVLEQVRLISNLETTRDKLLQIILIGEPILTKMLNSNDLRQIGQRVSVGYHISAFTYDETMVYIQHRVTMASKGSPVRFDPKAVRRIFRYSGGVPKAINIACERALKIAFYRKEKLITAEIVEEAVTSLAGRSETAYSRPRRWKMIGWITAACGLLAAVGSMVLFMEQRSAETPAEQIRSEKPQTDTAPVPASVIERNPDSHPETQSSRIVKKKVAEDDVVVSERPDEHPKQTYEASRVEAITPPKMTHSVQVGAFRNKEYAEQLLARLAARGYSAKIVPVEDTRAQTWLTVRIGDYPTREAAKAEAEDFSAREDMETVVRPFGKF